MKCNVYKMEDVLESLIDYRGKTPQKSDSGIMTLSAKSVRDGYIDYSQCYFISPEEYNRFMVRGFPKVGDVLLTTEAPLGVTARLDREDVAIAQRLLTLRGKSGVLDSGYLYYYLKSPVGQAKLLERQTGTTVTGIKQAEFRKILIEIPDISSQRKIVSILQSLDDKIKTNKMINENLTEQARAIFQSWFIDYEPFEGTAPSEWTNSTLGQIAVMKTDSWSPAKAPDLVVEHYSIPAFDEKHYPVFEIASGIKSNKYILTPESVMISKLNPDTKRIWRPLCLSEHPVCSTEFIVYEAIKEGQRDYIYSVLDSTPFLNHLCSHTTGSTNSRQRATPKSTLDYPIVLPTDSIIEEFCGIVTPMYNMIASNLIENQSLAQARDYLLPRLMSGMLDITDL